MAINLKEVRSFDFATPARFAASVRRFELNCRAFAEDVAKAFAYRFTPVKVEANTPHNSAPWEFIVAGNGSTSYLPEPSPALAGAEIALSVPSGTASVQCMSGASVVRGAASVTYSSATSTRFICTGQEWL